MGAVASKQDATRATATPSLSVRVRVGAQRFESEDTRSYELAPLGGSSLAPYAPGAHIDLLLPNGLSRQYSLLPRPNGDVYRIGVKREQTSRGGSSYIHDEMRVGDIVSISEPRNHFALHLGAAYSILLAGGIGVTPILSIAEALKQHGARFEFLYACRDEASAAFLGDVRAHPQARVHFDAVEGGPPRMLDVVANAPRDAHIYCCGPTPMIDACEAACLTRPDITLHVERFAAAHEAAVEGGFVVELARSRRSIAVEKGQSILAALTAAGVDVPRSCEEGVCGSCETRVLAGVPDHRDSILTEKERAQNAVMMVCCSGSRSPVLRLDL